MKTSPEAWALEHSIVSNQLKRFVAEKVAQATAAASAEGKEMWPQFKSLFAAAERGDLLAMRHIFAEMRRPALPREGSRPNPYCAHGSQWSTALELWGAFEQFGGCGEEYSVAFGRDVIASIPPGSIYFGGTDSGRFVVTALSPSHVNAEPFFTLTQSGLADKSYLQYLRSMYGERIYVPSEQEATKVFQEYVEDAQRRQKENKLRPGEFLQEVDGKVQVTGHIGVMAINGVLSKLVFDKNPEREFYVEESFPLEWMYPHLSPHGLILRVNRQPMSELSAETVQRDHEYWAGYIRSLIGDWLNDDTSIAEIAAFVQKMHLNHDLSGFQGDARFVQNDLPQRLFAKLRSSIGGVYSWRMASAQSAAEKERMVKEADFAFRQAWALCPRSPEAVFRYINALVVQRRFDDAILIAETALKIDAENIQLQHLARELKRMKNSQRS